MYISSNTLICTNSLHAHKLLRTAAHCCCTITTLHYSIDAARARCTLGEISLALEAKWGRHKLLTSVVHGAYSASYDSAGVDKEYEHVLAQVIYTEALKC
jgi:hypothetical protein